MNNILINGLALNSQFTGVQYYIENLVNAMKSNHLNSIGINFLVSKGYRGSTHSGGVMNLLSANVDTRSRMKRIYFENFKLKKFIRNTSHDLYHSPSYVLPFSPPLPSIVTVHDLIAITFPEYAKDETVLYHRILQRRSLKKAIKIIAVSHTVKRDIIRNYNIEEDKISVIYHGVNRTFKKILAADQLAAIHRKYALPSKYILFVGNIEPKKNLIKLFQAYDLIRRHTSFDHKLVIVGKIGWKCKDIFKAIDDLELRDEIVFLGYVEDCDLPSIYNLADLFVFPSLYEGFGIPPLEAMASEVPVLVSNGGALPEITGNICESFNAFDVREMASKIIALLSDDNLRKRTVLAGKEWVKSFTWEKAADKTLSLYTEVLKSKK